MFWRIVSFEWRLLSRDWTAAVAVAIFLLLGGYAVVGGLARVAAHRRAAETALCNQRESLRSLRTQIHAVEASAGVAATAPRQRDYGPHDPDSVLSATRHANVVLPVSPYAALAAGRAPAVPVVYSVMTLEIAINPYTDTLPSAAQPAIFGRATEVVANPLTLRAGAFDLAFVVVCLCPLVIIALCHDVVSSERESGTLALVLAQPVRLGMLLAAKLVVRAAIVAAPLAMLPAIAMGVATRFGLPGAGLRLLLWIALSWAYAAAWFALAVAVNALGRRSAFNALALTATWIALVVVLPAVGSLTAVLRYPAPPRLDLVNEVRTARNAARTAANEEVLRQQFLARHDDRIHDQTTMLDAMRTIVEEAPRDNALLDAFFARHPEVASDRRFTQTELFHVLLAAQEDEVERRTQQVRDRIARALEAQRRWIDGWAVVLPPLLVERILEDVADAGDARFVRFFDAMAAYQARQRAFFWPRMFTTTPISSHELDRLPRFEYEEESAGNIARRAAGCLVLLMVTAALIVAVGARRFRRTTLAVT